MAGELRGSLRSRLPWATFLAPVSLATSTIPVTAAEPSAPPHEIVLPQASERGDAHPSKRSERQIESEGGWTCVPRQGCPSLLGTLIMSKGLAP